MAEPGTLLVRIEVRAVEGMDYLKKLASSWPEGEDPDAPVVEADLVIRRKHVLAALKDGKKGRLRTYAVVQKTDLVDVAVL